MFKSKKIVALLLAVLMIATLMVGCSTEKPAESKPVESKPVESKPVESTPVESKPVEEPKPSADDQEPVTLIAATGVSSGTVGCNMFEWFCNEITTRTEGKVTVEAYPSGQLYKANQLADACMSGAIDIMLNGTASNWPDYCPVFAFTEAWFVWTGREHVKANVEAYKELLFPLWEEEIGVKPLYLADNGEGGFLTKTKVTKPEDMKGLLMVGPNQPDWDAIATIGATPVQMAASERYDALAKGAIDGLRLAYVGFVKYNLQDHCEYFVPGASITMFGMIMNMDTWNSLSVWAQEIIMEIAAEAEAMTFEGMEKQDADYIKIMEEACETHYLTAEEVAVFQEALQPFYDGLLQKCIDAGYGDQAKKFLEIAAG